VALARRDATALRDRLNDSLALLHDTPNLLILSETLARAPTTLPTTRGSMQHAKLSALQRYSCLCAAHPCAPLIGCGNIGRLTVTHVKTRTQIRATTVVRRAKRRDRRADPAGGFAFGLKILQMTTSFGGLQNQCGRVAHGSVGSTPAAPLPPRRPAGTYF
jgi:hypothetical protein